MSKTGLVATCLIASFFLAEGALAAKEVDMEQMLLSLEEDMQNIQESAFKSKQNIDYKPYIISVIQHDELQKLGVANLREALKLVPGVDISVGMMGVMYPVFRGSNPYAMGQSQLYIDGVAVNDAIFNGYYHYLDMPTEIIERIEVVRGPGSLLAHEHAYGGSINVITCAGDTLNETKETRLFGGAGSNDYRFAGGQMLVKEGTWVLSADVYYQDASRHSFEGPDYLGDSREAYFDNENYAVAFHARDAHWKIGGRFTSQVTGPSYGQMFTLSEDPTDYLDIRTNNINVEYTTPVAEKTTLKVAGDYLDQRRRLKNKTFDDNTTTMTMLPNGSMGMATFTNGRYFYVDYDERKLSALAEVQHYGLDQWNLTAGLKHTLFTSERDDARMTTPDGSMMPMMSTDLLFTDRREITTLYGEAVYEPVEAMSVAAGFKYDDVSDHGKIFSPRLSAVYLLDPNNILKAMTTHSYRLPSWREEYFFGAASNYGYIDTEKVESYELSYVHKAYSGDSLRFNLFYLKNRDQVEINPINKVATDKYDTTIKGGEFELQGSLGSSDQIRLNYSYARGTIDGSGAEIPNSAKQMATLSNIYRFNDKLTTGTVLKYVGEKARDVADARDDLDDYITWDQSIQYYDYRKDYSLSLTVQNVTDETYYLPAVMGTYPNDFRQPGRNVWIRFEKRWQ